MATIREQFLLVAVIIHSCYCGDQSILHQERHSRLIPDYEPFQHPAKKNLPTPTSNFIIGPRPSGPITHIEWIEEVIPVFGRILITQADVRTKTAPNYPTYVMIILGCAALLLTSVTIKQTQKAKYVEKKEISDDGVNVLNLSQEKVDQETFVEEVFKLSKETDTIEHGENNLEEKVSDLSDNILKEKIEVSFQHGTASLSSTQDYSVQLENILPQQKDEKIVKIDHSKREWCYYQEFELEDVEWIRKIKTFKITKYPKTHQASKTHHGNLHNCLESLELTKLTSATDLNTVFEHDTALISIEGGNSSRLRITVVKDTNEEESIAKIMTVKEYLCSVSNDIIQDALNKVKENGSLENIQSLAYTIRKYRPQSAESQSL